jgi:hypothetical protein
LNSLRQLVIITVPCLPAFQIREILAQIWIIGSIPEKTDPDMYIYKYELTFEIKVIFLVILKCKKIQKCILSVKISFRHKNVAIFSKISYIFTIPKFAKFANKKNISRRRNFVDHPITSELIVLVYTVNVRCHC